MKGLKQIKIVDKDSCELAKELWGTLSDGNKDKVLKTIFLSTVLDDLIRGHMLVLVDGGKLVIPVDQLLEVFPYIDGVSYELDLCRFPDKSDNVVNSPRCSGPGEEDDEFDISYRAKRDWKGGTPIQVVKEGDILYPWLGSDYGVSVYGVGPGEEVLQVTRRRGETPFFPVPKRILGEMVPNAGPISHPGMRKR